MTQEKVISVDHNRNRLADKDSAVHAWYRFVLGYPPHLVTQYLEKFGADPKKDVIFDPFCGTGTTPVEAKKQGFRSVASDANPVASFATRVKTTWDLDLHDLAETNERIIEEYEVALRKAGLDTETPPLFKNSCDDTPQIPPPDPGAVKRSLPKELARVMPFGFISPLPFRKVLLLRELISKIPNMEARDLYRLALAAILVEGVGNVGFGPEIYMTRPKIDAPVLRLFSKKIQSMLGDLRQIQEEGLHKVASEISQDDARMLSKIGNNLFDIVITSPPYPNEKDYTRSTRLESLILGFIKNIDDLRAVKRNLIKSNTRTIFKGESDDKHIARFASIHSLSKEIEQRRIELGKTSGFERLYHRVVTLYFGGIYRHLDVLRSHLRHKARLGYVVGDQMSFFRIHIRTGELVAEIADDLGYKVDGIDLWRERLSTTTKLMLREEVVILRHP